MKLLKKISAVFSERKGGRRRNRRSREDTHIWRTTANIRHPRNQQNDHNDDDKCIHSISSNENTVAATSTITNTTSTKYTFNSVKRVFQAEKLIINFLEITYGEGPYPHDVNPLHVACIQGFPPKIVSWVLSKFKWQVSKSDENGRLPLHYTILCICKEEIPFEEGVEIVGLLCAADASMICFEDHSSKAPIDIVELTVLELRRLSKNTEKYTERKRRLEGLSRHPRRIVPRKDRF